MSSYSCFLSEINTREHRAVSRVHARRTRSLQPRRPIRYAGAAGGTFVMEQRVMTLIIGLHERPAFVVHQRWRADGKDRCVHQPLGEHACVATGSIAHGDIDSAANN